MPRIIDIDVHPKTDTPPPLLRSRLSRADLAAMVTMIGTTAAVVGVVVGYSAGVLATLSQPRKDDHAV